MNNGRPTTLAQGRITRANPATGQCSALLEKMHFQGKWRDYQERVLDEFDHHLEDCKINVVAAPGSGKTLLGLELVRRLGRRAIILSPSLTIRNQWAERLVPLFMPEKPAGDFVSFDLEKPGVLTMGTYQSLHAIQTEESGARFDAFLAWAKRQGPLTLVLDEAHHLRREWWRALTALLEEIEDARIVALTATPPYDAPLAEWRRFEKACGPIDIEVGIPELVRNGDLCPHQDHVVFSRPSSDLLAILAERRQSISRLVGELRADTSLADRIEDHPWVRLPFNNLDQILDDPAALSAMLVHLAALDRPLPDQPLSLLCVDAASVPQQNEKWTEKLLNALLYDLGESSPLGAEDRKSLGDKLHRLGLIEGSRVRLGESKRIVRMMAGDRTKIDSIGDIAEREASWRRSDLRMVVLADHVRAGELPKGPIDDFKPAKIGVAPIFEALRRKNLDSQKVAILTGSLVVLPQDACEALLALGQVRGIPASDLKSSILPHCGTHRRVDARGAGRKAIVTLVTQLFQHGDITILVGTQALLGEGWDAPAIDSLVLASNSASFMLSNQMRGRAIRVDPLRPHKVSNIWHLATVPDPDELPAIGTTARWFDWGGIHEGEPITADIRLLRRRFKAFAGISNGSDRRIGTGIDRLGLEHHKTLREANAATFHRAADRGAIAKDWQASLGDAPARAHVREIAAPRHSPRRLIWRQTLQSLGLGGLAAGAMAGSYSLLGTIGAQPATLALAGAATAAGIASLPKIFKSVRLAWRNGTLESSLRQVGDAILASLNETGLLSDREYRAAAVVATSEISGIRAIHFEGLTRSIDIMAMDMVAELLGPVQNPRYLLVRKGGMAGQSRDYHNVPAIFARTRKNAEIFARHWARCVGQSDLIWTRSESGRRVLLQARRASLAAGMQRRVDRRSDWR